MKWKAALGFLRQKALEQLQISLTDHQMQQIENYTKLLIEWNEKINLTTITEPEEIMVKHFLDSFAFVADLNRYYQDQKIRIADLGTGAGFPGIPIKICLPEVEVVLLDALAKRIAFLNQVKEELQLKGIETHHCRAEDIGRDPNYRETFEVVVARAVAELPILLEYTVPLLKNGGRLFAAKGMDPEQEITQASNALQVLNCHVQDLRKYTLAPGAEHRSMIIIQKVRPTHQKYPRQAGKPKKSPL